MSKDEKTRVNKATNGKTVVKVEELRKTYGKTVAVENISFEVYARARRNPLNTSQALFFLYVVWDLVTKGFSWSMTFWARKVNSVWAEAMLR